MVAVFKGITRELYGTRSANFNRLICTLWHAFEKDERGFKTESSHGPMCMCKRPIHFAQANTENAARAVRDFYHNSKCTAVNLTELLHGDPRIAEKLALVIVWSIQAHENRGAYLHLEAFLNTIDVLMEQHKDGLPMSLMDTASGVVAEVAVPVSDEVAVLGSDEEAVSGSDAVAVSVSDEVSGSWADQMCGTIAAAVRPSVAAAAHLASGAETEAEAPDALVPTEAPDALVPEEAHV